MSDRELTLEADADPQSVTFHDNLKIFTFNGPPFRIFKADINKLTTLTKFGLNQVHPTDKPTIKDLLGILEKNPKLENVFIHIEDHKLVPGINPALDYQIELSGLKFLFLATKYWMDTKDMISRIYIPNTKGIEVQICCSKLIPLDDAFKSIKIPSSLTRMTMRFSGLHSLIKWTEDVEGKESFSLFPVSSLDMCNALAGHCHNFSGRNIKRLELKVNDDTQILPKSNSFPALETITVHHGKITADQKRSFRAFANSLGLDKEEISSEGSIWHKY